jgi:hypothetical protein
MSNRTARLFSQNKAPCGALPTWWKFCTELKKINVKMTALHYYKRRFITITTAQYRPVSNGNNVPGLEYLSLLLAPAK